MKEAGKVCFMEKMAMGAGAVIGRTRLPTQGVKDACCRATGGWGRGAEADEDEAKAKRFAST